MTLRTRWHLWRSRKATVRRVRNLAGSVSMLYLTDDGPSLTGPVAPPRGVCHICWYGTFTKRDRFSGARCCDHCGAAMDQIPGATPRDGVACVPEHLTGTCGCRSVGRPDLDARERERVFG